MSPEEIATMAAEEAAAASLKNPPVETKVEPEKKIEKPAPPTKTQKEAVGDFLNRFSKGPEKAEADKLADAQAVEDEKNKKKPAAKKKAAVVASTGKLAPTPAGPDYDKIAEATARGVAEAMKPKPEEKRAAEKPNYDFLDDSERKKLPILEQMEAANPTAYKGLTKKFTEAIKARQEYEAAWLKENKGKEFDPEADEHNDFFKSVEVDWNDDDYAEAIADIKVAKLKSDMEKKTGEEIGKLTARDKARETEPLALSAAKATGRTFFDAVGEEFKGILSPEGVVNKEAIAKLYKDDEVKAGIVFGAASGLEQMAAENVRLFNGAVAFDANAPIHQTLANYALAQESAMEQLSLDDKKNKNGQIFTPAVDYYKMSKAEKAKHWTFSAADLNMMLAADTIRDVKSRIDADEKILQARLAKRGYKKPDADADENGEEPAPESRREEVIKPTSPTSSETLITSNGRNGRGAAPQKGVKSFITRMLSK